MDCRCNDINFLEGAEADDYAEEHLKKIGSNSITWEVEYVCPIIGKKWILDYPQSECHGGGPPRLRAVL